MKYITIEDVEGTEECECVFTYLNGCESICYINWNEYYYWIWFEVSETMYDNLEKFPEIKSVIDEAEGDFNKLAVIYCEDLDEANKIIKKYTGDNEEHGFVDDETFGGVRSY